MNNYTQEQAKYIRLLELLKDTSYQSLDKITIPNANADFTLINQYFELIEKYKSMPVTIGQVVDFIKENHNIALEEVILKTAIQFPYNFSAIHSDNLNKINDSQFEKINNLNQLYQNNKQWFIDKKLILNNIKHIDDFYHHIISELDDFPPNYQASIKEFKPNNVVDKIANYYHKHGIVYEPFAKITSRIWVGFMTVICIILTTFVHSLAFPLFLLFIYSIAWIIGFDKVNKTIGAWISKPLIRKHLNKSIKQAPEKMYFLINYFYDKNDVYYLMNNNFSDYNNTFYKALLNRFDFYAQKYHISGKLLADIVQKKEGFEPKLPFGILITQLKIYAKFSFEYDNSITYPYIQNEAEVNKIIELIEKINEVYSQPNIRFLPLKITNEDYISQLIKAHNEYSKILLRGLMAA